MRDPCRVYRIAAERVLAGIPAEHREWALDRFLDDVERLHGVYGVSAPAWVGRLRHLAGDPSSVRPPGNQESGEPR